MSNNKFKVLVVEDEANICSFIYTLLETNGYQTFVAPSCELGQSMFGSCNPDLIILDLGLPDRDGVELIRYVRQKYLTPIIVLSARTTEADKIEALDLGANDYITKPFGTGELLARVRAVLRRAQPVQAERKEPEEDGVVRVRGLWMDRKSMKARMDGVPMDLTALEFRILFGMAAHPGRVFTRENLLELAVGREFSRYDRSVDMHISTLRRKLGDDPHNPAYLKTIRGMGYTLLPEEA